MCVCVLFPLLSCTISFGSATCFVPRGWPPLSLRHKLFLVVVVVVVVFFYELLLQS